MFRTLNCAFFKNTVQFMYSRLQVLSPKGYELKAVSPVNQTKPNQDNYENIYPAY